MKKTIDETELLDPTVLENKSNAEKELVIDAEKVGNSPKAVNRDPDAGGITQQNVNREAIEAGESETGDDWIFPAVSLTSTRRPTRRLLRTNTTNNHRSKMILPTAVETVRRRAIAHSLFAPTTLKNAVERLKFVQADPIRSPARAQDLILRQRVENYRVGDLEREYPSLELEEDFLYAYGFMTEEVRRLLHPRKKAEFSEFEQQVLQTVEEFGETHPKHLEIYFGRTRVVNAWGGFSKATTRALEKLHHLGFLRVARRANGIRVYQVAPITPDESLSLSERLRQLVLITANIFAPVTERCLQESLSSLRRWLPLPVDTKSVVAELLKSGGLEKQIVEGISYLYPPDKLVDDEIPRTVKFLAPFDPLVWDRRRFEHFWGWAYRFEAYTPPAKRLRGYYAMPLLWGDQIIGWANTRVQNNNLSVEFGFAGKKPIGSDFSLELEKEVERLKIFLNLAA